MRHGRARALWQEYKVAYRDCVDWAGRWCVPLGWLVTLYDHCVWLRDQT